MKQFIMIVLGCVIGASAFAEADLSSEIHTTAPRPVITQRVGADALRATGFVGTVAAGNEVKLGFPISGTLAERRVDLGALVSQNDVLARLDPKDLQAAMRSAQAGVLVAQTHLDTAQDAADRAAELAERGVDSTTRHEDALRALVAAQAGAEQAQANLARAQDNLDLSELRAPHGGVITGAFLDAGALVSAGLEVVRLASTQERKVVVDVSEQGLVDMDIGMQFAVSLVANPAQATTAQLLRIDPVANGATRTRRAHLVLADPPPGFRFGALVRLHAIADAVDVVSVPMTAVLNPNGEAAVWVVNRSQNTVTQQPVTLGARFGTHVRVTDGLATGDEVVLRGIHSLREGQTIGRSMSQ